MVLCRLAEKDAERCEKQMNSLVVTAATSAATGGYPVTRLSRQNVHGNGVLYRHHMPVV